MVLSTSQQVAVSFTAVLLTFVVLPRLLGGGGGGGGGGTVKENRFDSRHGRKAAGPGPAGARGQPVNMNGPGPSQTPENIQQMKKLMEQELKSDKYKSNGNKGYVFTLMPLYAVGVGMFAAYKFLKIRSADDQAQKDSLAKGAKKSVEAENQLNELEQRLAQTERMLNSILTQLDPLTNCVKSVAQEQKNEIISQLQTIKCLMKKRGMDCPPLKINDTSCGRNLSDLIESFGAADPSETEASLPNNQSSADSSEHVYPKCMEDVKELAPEQSDVLAEEEGSEEEEDCDLIPSLEGPSETNTEEVGGAEPATGLRRRTRPE